MAASFDTTVLLKTDGSPYRILVAEDKSLDQMIATHVLQNIGCQVELAKDGVQALEKMKNTHYDLVFMDCSMPIMDGYEATRMQRKHESKLRIKMHTTIIALTANILISDRKRCIAAGMDDYITKPIRQEKASKMIVKWCREYVPQEEQW